MKVRVIFSLKSYFVFMAVALFSGVPMSYAAEEGIHVSASNFSFFVGALKDTSCRNIDFLEDKWVGASAPDVPDAAIARYYAASKVGDLESYADNLRDDGTRELVMAGISSADDLKYTIRNVRKISCEYALNFKGVSLYRMRIDAVRSSPREEPYVLRTVMASICESGRCYVSFRQKTDAVEALFYLIESGQANKAEPKKTEDSLRGGLRLFPEDSRLDFPISIGYGSGGAYRIHGSASTALVGNSGARGRSGIRYQRKYGALPEKMDMQSWLLSTKRAGSPEVTGFLMAGKVDDANEKFAVVKFTQEKILPPQVIQVSCVQSECAPEETQANTPEWQILMSFVSAPSK